MTATANIICCVCGARPFPPDGVRQTYDLLKLAQREDKKTGETYWAPADETEGEWFCERHRRVHNSRFVVMEATP
jgi:hypothetical protein